MTDQPPYVLDVFVSGHPRPQGSIKAIVHRHTGRAVAVKDNNRTQKTWRADVRETVQRYWHSPPIDGPVRVRCDFVMPRPLSTPKRRTPPAVKKPDGDKLLRAVWDALTHLVWVDDSRIVSWSGSKRLAELGETPGCRIRVSRVLRDPDSWGVAAEPAAPAEQARLAEGIRLAQRHLPPKVAALIAAEITFYHQLLWPAIPRRVDAVIQELIDLGDAGMSDTNRADRSDSR